MNMTSLTNQRSPRQEASEASETTAIVSPNKLRRDIPLSSSARETVEKARSDLSEILVGRDQKRVAVICGPCSIDDVNSALVYASRMSRLAAEVEDKIVLVMRTYFEKPRSVVGWKGLLYDPMLEGDASPSSGLTIARRLAVRLNESGVACATEFLNPLMSLYLEDCMAYGSIGSRTVESQIHRELASRLSFAIGMKNAMDGNPASALNAVKSAQNAHSYFGQDLEGSPALIETKGNRDAHVILRGGSSGPNFAEEIVSEVVEQGQSLGLARPVVVDCSHGNSNKDHRKQALVAKEIGRQICSGQKGVAGIMLESHLIEGRQEADQPGGRQFGRSITDACIGWKDTECLVKDLASVL